MSLMAGFDLVIEISRETILKLIKNFKLGDVPLNPPFELEIPITTNGVSGFAHIIVNELLFELVGDHELKLTLMFGDSSVFITSPLTLDVTGLDGDFEITASMQFMDTVPMHRALSVNLQAATTAINFTPTAETRILSALSGTPLRPRDFKDIANQELQNYVRSIGLKPLPFEFMVEPGVNGSIKPLPKFEKIEAHNIGNEAVGVFGILLLANDANADHTQKTGTAIMAGHSVCISISPGAVHSLIFCPAVVCSLARDTTMLTETQCLESGGEVLSSLIAFLPPSCGQAEGIVRDGVTITNISDSFASGHIDINGSFKKSGHCYEAHGSFHASISYHLSEGNLVPTVALDKPQVDVDIAWYCWLASTVLWNAFGPVILVGIEHVALEIANTAAQKTIGKAFKNFEETGTDLNLPGVFDEVAVTPEGMTMNGKLSVSVPSVFGKNLSISGSVVTSNKERLGASETYHEESGCLAGDYSFEQQLQHQVGFYEAFARLLGRPLALEWELAYGYGLSTSTPLVISSAPLIGPSGTVTLSNVETHYPVPLPGGSALTQPVNIEYSISGDRVQLRNMPLEGNYSVWLSVTATEPDGDVLKAGMSVQFEGYAVTMGSGYQEKVAECFSNILREMRRVGVKQPNNPIPPWVPVNHPKPDELLTLMRYLASVGTLQAEDVLAHTRLSHGSSFYRAIFSQEAPTIGLKGLKPQNDQ